MTEMTKLSALLTENNLPFAVNIFDGICPQILGYTYADKHFSEPLYDLICTPYSYGGREGLLEMMDRTNLHLFGDDEDVLGYLTAEDALKYILKYYTKEW